MTVVTGKLTAALTLAESLHLGGQPLPVEHWQELERTSAPWQDLARLARFDLTLKDSHVKHCVRTQKLNMPGLRRAALTLIGRSDLDCGTETILSAIAVAVDTTGTRWAAPCAEALLTLLRNCLRPDTLPDVPHHRKPPKRLKDLGKILGDTAEWLNVHAPLSAEHRSALLPLIAEQLELFRPEDRNVGLDLKALTATVKLLGELDEQELRAILSIAAKHGRQDHVSLIETLLQTTPGSRSGTPAARQLLARVHPRLGTLDQTFALALHHSRRQRDALVWHFRPESTLPQIAQVIHEAEEGAWKNQPSGSFHVAQSELQDALAFPSVWLGDLLGGLTWVRTLKPVDVPDPLAWLAVSTRSEKLRTTLAPQQWFWNRVQQALKARPARKTGQKKPPSEAQGHLAKPGGEGSEVPVIPADVAGDVTHVVHPA